MTTFRWRLYIKTIVKQNRTIRPIWNLNISSRNFTVILVFFSPTWKVEELIDCWREFEFEEEQAVSAVHKLIATVSIMTLSIFCSPQALCSLIGSLWGPVAGAFSGYGSVALPSFDADPDAPFFMNEGEKAFFSKFSRRHFYHRMPLAWLRNSISNVAEHVWSSLQDWTSLRQKKWYCT
jgi:hypothetical protein